MEMINSKTLIIYETNPYILIFTLLMNVQKFSNVHFYEIILSLLYHEIKLFYME